MNFHAILQGLGWTLPEVILGGFILVVILADLLPRRSKTFVAVVALLGIALAGVATFQYLQSYPRIPSFPAIWRKSPDLAAPTAVFSGAYAIDHYSFFFKLMFLGTAFVVGLFSIPAIREWKTGKGEFFALLLSCTFGMLLMSGANDLLMMYLSLEFVSVTGYIMAGLLRKNRKSAEASLKYIIYGAAASGFMIYGMTFLYGLTGTLQISELGNKLALLNVPPTMTLITSVLVMAGFAYKIAAVPFHMWCPDVYEGAPTPVAAFFSVGPKAAGFAMLVRFLLNIYPESPAGPFEWKLVIALLSVLTMAVGNFAALQQQNLKRLLAYSSIAHAGYILIALTVATPEAISAMMFYLFVYVIMNLGAFLVVLVLEQKHGIETVDGCRGLGWRAPGLGVLMTVFLLSLTGIPPTAGFTGKVLVFSYVIQSGHPHYELGIALVVVAVIFTVISLFYYARIIAAMFLAKPREAEAREAPAAGFIYSTILWILAIGTVWFGLAWGPLQGLTSEAAKSMLR